jgi:predicted phosphodiesterase
MITVIGDVHGHYDQYERMARKRDFTVQLGDLGFKYGCLRNLDSSRHKVIGGNHDNYDIIHEFPNYLGDFGNCSLGGVDFFFLRGAYSIDRDLRTIGIDWWPQEEISHESFELAKELYKKTSPKIVITHCCPHSIIPHFLYPLDATGKVYNTRTDWGLQELFEVHKPSLWLFGHYHVSKSVDIEGTRFVCLNELEAFDLM